MTLTFRKIAASILLAISVFLFPTYQLLAALPENSHCTSDDQCATGICNQFNSACHYKLEENKNCKRDTECSSGICNQFSSACKFKLGENGNCRRDIECASSICNQYSSACKFKLGEGGHCKRDMECMTFHHCNQWSGCTTKQ